MKFNPLSLLTRMGIQSPAFFALEVAALLAVLALAGTVVAWQGNVRADVAASLNRQASASEARALAAEAALAGQAASLEGEFLRGMYSMCYIVTRDPGNCNQWAAEAAARHVHAQPEIFSVGYEPPADAP